MGSNVSGGRVFATKSSFEDRRDRVLTSDCALELGSLLASIGMQKGRDEERREVFQRVLERKVDVGSVALQCLFHLSTFGVEAHRKAVYTIIERGCTFDTEHIFGGAVASMLKLNDLTSDDVRVVAGALFGSSNEVRAMTRRGLRSLEPHELRRMIEMNDENIRACAPFARAFADFAEKTIAELHNFQAAVLPKLTAFHGADGRADVANSPR